MRSTGLPQYRRTASLLSAVLLVCGLSVTGFPSPAHAQATSTPLQEKAPATAERGASWRSLQPSQQVSLKPLESAWSSFDAEQKLKWLEIAQRMPTMPSDEQARIQLRMSEWVMLGPIERGRVRFNFQEAKQQLSPEQRRAQWKAYQALSDEEKRQLADARRVNLSRGKAQPGNTMDPKPSPVAAATRNPSTIAAATPITKKSNITPNPAFAQPPTPVAATLLHPSYGATTTLVSKTATPPAHQQVGLPKIVASSRFIDPKTLLPRRGPQAAAAFTTAASSDTPLERP